MKMKMTRMRGSGKIGVSHVPELGIKQDQEAKVSLIEACVKGIIKGDPSNELLLPLIDLYQEVVEAVGVEAVRRGHTS